jgi:protein SCO1/2
MGVLSDRALPTRPRYRAGEAGARLILALVWAVLGGLAAGCDDDRPGGPGRYSATGTVEDVDRERGQVLIEHGDVEGLMPGMTMNFTVPDRSLLERLEPGQRIEFEILFTGRSYEVVTAEVIGQASAEEGWRRLGDALVRTRPVPDFELIDQAGEPVSLESLGDRVLLIDFIYTSCPGPCPVQTANQVALQREIPEALRSKVHFVSISLDPGTDDPEALRRYARERGADLTSWSFLTGPREAVAEVVQGFGVGSLRQEDGTIDHTLITFLVRDGVVLEHYSGLEGRDGKLLADVIAATR